MKKTSHRVREMMVFRRDFPFHSFEPLESTLHNTSSSFEKALSGLITKGYTIPPSYLFKLDEPLPWQHAERSVAYSLQAFDPLSVLLRAHSLTHRQDYFNLVLTFVEDWLKHLRPPTEKEYEGLWEESSPHDFLWYDMAVGLRASRLAYIVDHLLRTDSVDEGRLSALLEILDWHRTLLMHDKAFLSHNNHGLYQALGQMAMARRFPDDEGMRAAFRQGEDRLTLMLNQQFCQEGVHKEHSPGYHWMLLCTLVEALKAGLIQKEDHKQCVTRIEDSMSWFILPKGTLPAFGDTDTGSLRHRSYQAKDFDNPFLKYALSHGEQGEAPHDFLKIYEEAGYAVCRHYDTQDPSKGSYLAQQAGFHSLSHKHADHLTCVWHDKGQDILVDAGRYGYKGRTEKGSDLWKQGFWYADPKRIYVEKTRAHNTLEIDGLDVPRRKVKPFGSALKRSTSTPHPVYAIESEYRPFQSIRHGRVLFFKPGSFLIVFDWIKDNHNQPHDFRQWFHLGQELDLIVEETGLLLTHKGQPFASVLPLLSDVSLDHLIRGQSDPELNGWVSFEKGGLLVPNWAFAYSALHRPQCAFATLFSLHPDAHHAFESDISPSFQSGQFSWKDGGGSHKVSFIRRSQDFKVHYRCDASPNTL